MYIHTHTSEIVTNQFEQLLGARHLSDGQIILEGKIKKEAGDLGENQKSVVLQIKRWKLRKLWLLISKVSEKLIKTRKSCTLLKK